MRARAIEALWSAPAERSVDGALTSVNESGHRPIRCRLRCSTIAACRVASRRTPKCSAYDNNLRSLLSEDGYKRYRDYEKSKPARREYEMIKEHAATKLGLSLDAGQADSIVALIRDAGATTTETWHGPYDPLPRPVAGAELVDQMQADYLSLLNNANSLLTAAAESGMSEEYLQILQEYYTDKTQAGYDKWIFWNRPIEDTRAEIRVRTIQQIRDAQRAGSP